MEMYRLFVCSVLAIFAVLANRESRDYRCALFASHHCYGEDYDPQCGSNNFTYYNKCEFAKDHCRSGNIHLAHNGTCHGESQSGNLTHGQFVVLQYTCKTLLLNGCIDDIAEVCASNGNTYINECEFEMYRCMHPDLQIVNRAPCGAST